MLGTVRKLAGILSLGSVALASGTVGQMLSGAPRLTVWQERFTGAVMLGLGFRLLFSGAGGAAVRM